MIVCGYEIKDNCIILEPRKVFDRGVVGYDDQENKLIYSLSLLVDAMCDLWGSSWIDALDYLMYNTKRALDYMDNPPILEDDIDD
jgi:hypothetical protein